jgi:hypothetical protein
LKKILPIGLLVLLLYNTFGLSFAILFFEKDFKSASLTEQQDTWKVVKMHLPSLPYSGDLEVAETMEVLVRQDGNFYNPTEITHQNDTLYVTLKSNQAARDRFFELANAMQTGCADTDLPQSPYGKVIKQLTDLAKDYVPGKTTFQVLSKTSNLHTEGIVSYSPAIGYAPFKKSLPTPPPEFC